MKIATFLTFFGNLSHGYVDERGLPERYIYEKPLCKSIADCVGINGCNGTLFTSTSGQFGLNGYKDRFSCRWEIKASPGSKIKVLFADSFQNTISKFPLKI